MIGARCSDHVKEFQTGPIKVHTIELIVRTLREIDTSYYCYTL